jgi:putative ATPase
MSKAIAASGGSLFATGADLPLPERLRPSTLADVIGQDHLLAPGAPLATMVAAGKISSLILWGPPGTGKTTIARLLAKDTDLHYVTLSAVASGIADMRKVFEEAERRQLMGCGTLLFIDEIHRFNKAQQDVLLPYVEKGTVILVGATTENPSFELNNALLSRCPVYVLRRLEKENMMQLLAKAELYFKKPIQLGEAAREYLMAASDGDARYFLTLIDHLMMQEGGALLTVSELQRHIQRRAPLYDKGDEGHYNLISALHKSMRGSDPDAALYWFARMLEGGEDPRYIARRLTRFAAEDIGLADPDALTLAVSGWQTYERLGSPEGEVALTQVVLYLATAPKSNAAYVAYNQAREAAKNHGSLAPPKHILNAPTRLMQEMGYGKGYVYDPDTKSGFSGQNYFPETMPRQNFYAPKGKGFEAEILRRLQHWQAEREQAAAGDVSDKDKNEK